MTHEDSQHVFTCKVQNWRRWIEKWCYPEHWNMIERIPISLVILFFSLASRLVANVATQLSPQLPQVAKFCAWGGADLMTWKLTSGYDGKSIIPIVHRVVTTKIIMIRKQWPHVGFKGLHLVMCSHMQKKYLHHT
jgi:hypothetical protein